jgi:hypothetical protein
MVSLLWLFFNAGRDAGFGIRRQQCCLGWFDHWYIAGNFRWAMKTVCWVLDGGFFPGSLL